MQWVLDDITSGRSGQQCVKPWAKHTNTNETIDFFVELSAAALAVDAATMLEGFHSYAQQLYLIGEAQEPGSNRQKVPFALAKWFFDTGDRARLTVSTGTPP